MFIHNKYIYNFFLLILLLQFNPDLNKVYGIICINTKWDLFANFLSSFHV